MFKRILVASDLTAQSASALELARGFGQTFSSRIVVAHVIAMPPVLKRWEKAPAKKDLDSYDLLLRQQLADAEIRLNRQVSIAGLASARGIRVLVRSGVPAPTLAELVDKLDADLVIAARGRGGHLGAVAEQLVRLVGRTVLIAPVRLKLASPGKLPRPQASAKRARRPAA